jgi:hypothetical protein
MLGMPGFDEVSNFYRKAGWQRKFTFWPRRCWISNRIIWLQYAYKGTAVWTGPGTPAIEHQWHSAKEHIIWKLKGNYA